VKGNDFKVTDSPPWKGGAGGWLINKRYFRQMPKKFFEKSGAKVWLFGKKAVPLHPLTKNEGA
jgi:hypothetical protein